MDKKKRHAALLKIISEREIETQEELRARLLKAGFDVTQATVSRDIRELRIDKGLSANGINCYFAQGAGRAAEYNELFAKAVTELDCAMNMVVVKCHAGLASAAGKVIDEQKLGFVVGTIAGDDTVFVVTRSENHAVQLVEQLKRMLTR